MVGQGYVFIGATLLPGGAVSVTNNHDLIKKMHSDLHLFLECLLAYNTKSFGLKEVIMGYTLLTGSLGEVTKLVT